MMALLRFLSLCILILTLLLLRLCFSSFAGSRFVLALPPPPPSPLPALVGSNCPSRCATLSNISFPFSIMSPNISSSCGLPDFRLNCSHSTPDISWWPENFPLPLASILKITANHITSGTFVVGPPPAFSGPPIDACSPRQVNSLISSPPSDFKIPLGLQFSPHGNIILLTNCSDNLTSGINVNETIDGFSFSSPNCLRYDSVCSNAIRGSVPCLEAISADANVSLVQQRYGCLYNIALYELPKYANATLSLQISWAISQSYYDCKACEGSNGSCTVNNFNDSFQCLCPNDRHASSPGNICGSAETPQFCKGICKNNVHIFIGVAAIAVAILIVGAGFGVYCCRHRARLMRGGWQTPISAQRQSEDRLKQILAREDGAFPACTRKFSYMELCAATDGFAESKVLGDGGFGTVYEGTLKCNGEKVAVKRLYSENARRLEQFLNEIRILSTLNHPNLVRLHGFCCESFTELLLVYEFASNGTLADNLHGMTGKGELPWETRLCIALETAGALAYMHERDPPILHRDVKSSNILLDDRFHAKLADFGLSRRVYAKTNALHVSTAPQGTPGYVDPQYQQCYQLTDKSDVYSFGVVLMELISGMAPVDMSRRHNDHINLSSLAVSKIQTGALHELIDPFLLQECSGVPHMHDMVAGVAELAFLCLAPLQDDRPSMPQVTLALLDIARSSSSTGVTSNVSTPISLDSA